MLGRWTRIADLRRRRAMGKRLLASMVNGATEGESHVLTIATEEEEIVTYLRSEPQSFAVSNPSVAPLLASVVASGQSAALVLRTLNRDPYELRGVQYEGYTVRGWYLWQGHFKPQSEGECFNAFCTDAVTGEPVAPELGVTYASGYSLTA